MGKEKFRDSSVGQPEKGFSLPYPILVGVPAAALIAAGMLRSSEKEVIAGASLLGLELAILLLIKRSKVKKRN